MRTINFNVSRQKLLEQFGVTGDFDKIEVTHYKNGNYKIRVTKKKKPKKPKIPYVPRYIRLKAEVKKGKTPDEAWNTVMKHGTMSKTTRSKLEAYIERLK